MRPRTGRVSGGSPATADSLRTQLTVAADRLRTLEREIRDLRTENEVLRGEVLDLRRRQHRTPRTPGGKASEETRP